MRWRYNQLVPSKSPTLQTLFEALADRTRLRLINLMSRGELCVCYFVEILDEPQPKISRHLAYLRRSGLVGTRRDGKWIHYRVTKPSDLQVARVFESVLEALHQDREMQRDTKMLARACCAAVLPAGIQNAPRPTLTTDDR